MRATLLGLVGFAVGCGAATSASLREERVHFTAPGAPSTDYRTEVPPGEAVNGPHADAVRSAIARAGVGTQGALVPDPRLGTLAAWTLDYAVDHEQTLPHAVLDLWAHHLGLFEPAPHILVLAGPDPSGLEQHVAEEVHRILPQQAYTHWGAATLAQAGKHVVVLVLSWRWAALAPVPRALAPGDTLHVRGKLLPGYDTPELIVTRAQGATGASVPVRGGGAGAFAFEASLREAGAYRVELLAHSSLGPTVIANFPVEVGVAPQTQVDVVTRGAPPDEDDAVERLFDLVNTSRRAAGLAPLAFHRGLANVARAHDEDMRAHGFVGHTSPTTGNAPDRVARAGIRTHAVLENIGQGYSPEEVHEGLMQSPGHRANIMNPDATHVGIGIVTRKDTASTLYLVTQLFMRVARRIDVDDAPDRLLARIRAARAQRHLRALADDDALAEVCADAADAFFDSNASREELSARLGSTAQALRLPYRRMRAVVLVTDALDQAAKLDAFLDPDATAIGIGVAQGTRADTTPDAIVVVALLAYAH